MTDTKNIADLIEQVATEKQASEVDLTECPNELRPGRQSMKNASLQKYTELLGILRGAIGNYSGGVFVSGPGAKAFADLAEDEAPALVLDASELYRGIAEVWFPTVRVDKVFAVDCMPAFIMGLNAALFPLGVRRITPPDFGQRFGTRIESLDDATNLTRDILRTTLGDDLNVLYLRSRLAEKAVAETWDLKFITVVVLNATINETNAGTLFYDLFYGRSVEVKDVPENVDTNAVIIACKHLRAKVTGKTTSPTQTNENDQTETSPDNDEDETSPTEPGDISPRTGKPKRKYTRKPTTTQ